MVGVWMAPLFSILLPPISVFVGCDKVVRYGGYACVEYTEEKLLMHNINAIGSPNIFNGLSTFKCLTFDWFYQ